MNKQTEQFVAHKLAIDDILTALRAESDEHFGRAPDEITWGDVGVVAKAEAALREIAAFLNVKV